jgi:hypothetical protein
VQSLKASSFISVTESGITTVEKGEPQKSPLEIFVSDFDRVTFCKEQQPVKQFAPISDTESAIVTDLSDLQAKNACLPILFTDSGIVMFSSSLH